MLSYNSLKLKDYFNNCYESWNRSKKGRSLTNPLKKAINLSKLAIRRPP
jgi:hypothetical protein